MPMFVTQKVFDKLAIGFFGVLEQSYYFVRMLINLVSEISRRWRNCLVNTLGYGFTV